MDFRISAKAFIVKDDKLLIIKRRENDAHRPGVWDIPGGRLDIGENPYEGARRETKEEAGIDVEILGPLNIHHFTRDDDQIITMIVFVCRPLNMEVKLSEEHTEFEWIGIKDSFAKLVNCYHEDVEKFIKFYQGKL